MDKPYAGGKPDVPLQEFCDRFGYTKAEHFHGFLTREKNIGVLYHHGSISPRKNPDTYLRCEWEFPLGQRQGDREHFHHILFHVPRSAKHGAEESFCLGFKTFVRELRSTLSGVQKGAESVGVA
ncbi:MAG TPA: hypothetical protein VMV59_09455 [Candidatus Dormibacteraeota bacterium]|nr:hypothetical protein [Candidatus Dormibacteraeota bacterium]